MLVRRAFLNRLRVRPHRTPLVTRHWLARLAVRFFSRGSSCLAPTSEDQHAAEALRTVCGCDHAGRVGNLHCLAGACAGGGPLELTASTSGFGTACEGVLSPRHGGV